MIVVSDTSPLRALDHLGLLSLPSLLYGDVLIPPAVESELSRPRSRHRPVFVGSIPGVVAQAPACLPQGVPEISGLGQGGGRVRSRFCP